MTDGVCERNGCSNKNENRMCVYVDVYSTCVTLAEVNESRVTVTEECVLMIPASPSACVCV